MSLHSSLLCSLTSFVSQFSCFSFYSFVSDFVSETKFNFIINLSFLNRETTT